MLYISTWISLQDVEEIYPKLKQEPIFRNSPIMNECEYDDKHRDIVINELVKHNYVICGDTHQSWDHNGIPLFNDGYLMVSQRTWGEIMAEAYNLIQHNKGEEANYDYRDFYIASLCKVEERIPGEAHVQDIQ